MVNKFIFKIDIFLQVFRRLYIIKLSVRKKSNHVLEYKAFYIKSLILDILKTQNSLR